jgi:hypothetical protein
MSAHLVLRYAVLHPEKIAQPGKAEVTSLKSLNKQRGVMNYVYSPLI